MRLLCWNILRRNRRLDAVADLIRAQNADMVCLQEVPTHALSGLKALYPHAADCNELPATRKGGPSHLLTLSRFPIEGHTRVAHPVGRARSLREKMELSFPPRESLVTDLTTPSGHALRVINVHLSLFVPPRLRLAELAQALEHVSPHRATLVCGDFNTFANLPMNLLVAPFFGYGLRDLLSHERTALNRLLAPHGFDNVFSRTRTHSPLPFQLDHVLVPPGWQATRAEVVRRRAGSDHHPLLAELAPRPAARANAVG
jgi:endonuclease/exonuclease/phosphatase family metal-dependent hydrolase